jgi:cytosine/adenosine deaminase-related metal-dependent hydrolase
LFHTSDEAILAANELAKSYGDKLHIQLAERQRDLEVAESHYGTSPLKAMDKLGCLGDHLVIINGNALTEEEYALAKKHGCQFVLCPVSCMAKGDDVPNFPALVQHELPFTIGSDSASMNQGYSFLNELKWLNFAWRNKQGHFEQWQNCRLCSKIWSLGTEQAMMVLGQVPRSLAPGQFANFILMDISGPAFRPRWNFDREAFTSQLIFGSGRHADVQHLIVRGRTIVKNGSLVSVDLDPHYRHLDQWCNAYMQTLD